MRTSAWALIQYDWYSQNKRRRDTDTQGKHHVIKEAEIGNYAATNQGTPKDCCKLPESRTETWNRFFL